MSILINILLVIHVLISLFIILLVLMQRPKNEGLGAAFGGGMTDNLFGAQTTNVLQSGTRWLGGLFFMLTLMLSFLYVRSSSAKSSIQKSLSESAVPAATPAPQPVQVAVPPVKPAVEAEKNADGTPAATKTEGTAPGPGANNPVAPTPEKPADAPPAESKPDAPKPGTPAEEAPKPAPGAASGDSKPKEPAK